MSAPSALAEIVAWIEPIGGGWRYMFSPAFRAKVHESWRHEHIGYVLWDVFWGVAGIAMSLALLYSIFAFVLGAAASPA